MIKAKALARINSILVANGSGDFLQALVQNWRCLSSSSKEGQPRDCLHCREMEISRLPDIHPSLRNIISAHMGKDVISVTSCPG